MKKRLREAMRNYMIPKRIIGSAAAAAVVIGSLVATTQTAAADAGDHIQLAGGVTYWTVAGCQQGTYKGSYSLGRKTRARIEIYEWRHRICAFTADHAPGKHHMSIWMTLDPSVLSDPPAIAAISGYDRKHTRPLVGCKGCKMYVYGSISYPRAGKKYSRGFILVRP